MTENQEVSTQQKTGELYHNAVGDNRSKEGHVFPEPESQRVKGP